MGDTLTFFGFTERSRLVFFVTAISYALALLFIRWIGGTQQMNEEARWIVAIVVAAMVVFLPVFLANLIATPARFEREKQADSERERKRWMEERGDLEAELQAKLTNEEIEKQLGELIAEGRKLIEGITKGPEGPEAWSERVQDWRSRTTEFLRENVDFAKAQSWDAGAYRANASFQYEGASYSGDHALLASQVDLMLRSLQSTYLMPQRASRIREADQETPEPGPEEQ